MKEDHHPNISWSTLETRKQKRTKKGTWIGRSSTSVEIRAKMVD